MFEGTGNCAVNLWGFTDACFLLSPGPEVFVELFLINDLS